MARESGCQDEDCSLEATAQLPLAHSLSNLPLRLWAFD